MAFLQARRVMLVAHSLVILSALTFSQVVSAHSGRANADGCHAGSQPYHCHGAGKAKSRAASDSSRYDRKEYGNWADTDGDCKSTRPEVLERLNVGQIRYSLNGCRVVSGRWYGVFSGQYFYEAKQMDIDHILPVALAHRLGANAWPKTKKCQFFNDPANLIPVSARLNRAKGAKGPGQWLPPSEAYHCEYVTRFLRVGLKYGLISGDYRTRIDMVRERVC